MWAKERQAKTHRERSIDSSTCTHMNHWNTYMSYMKERSDNTVISEEALTTSTTLRGSCHYWEPIKKTVWLHVITTIWKKGVELTQFHLYNNVSGAHEKYKKKSEVLSWDPACTCILYVYGKICASH